MCVLTRVYKGESVVLRIAVCKRTSQSTKVNVVAVAKSYVIDTTNACRCATTSACTREHYSRARVLAVTTPDVCGTFCVILRNLTLVLCKVRLHTAIRSTTLSIPLYTLDIIK